MIRTIILLILVALAVVIAIPVVVSHFAPWWVVPIVIVAELAVLVVAVPLTIRACIAHFAKRIFLAKSAPLKDATATIHAVRIVEIEEEPSATGTAATDTATTEADPDEHAISTDVPAPTTTAVAEKPSQRHVQIDLTLIPVPTPSGPFRLYDPSELQLVPFATNTDFSPRRADPTEDPHAGHLHSAHRLDDTGAEFEDEDKIQGPARLRLTFTCPPTLQGRAKLRYYFVSFGDIKIPS